MSRQTPREDKRSHPMAMQWGGAYEAEEEAERKLIEELLDEALQNLEKRMGVATLARGGTLPGKRNIAAMARDGYLTQHTRQQLEEEAQAEEEAAAAAAAAAAEEEAEAADAEKRNVAALARNFNMPSGGKRNLASRARSMSRYGAVKRNIATLLRSRINNKRQPYAYARLSGVREDDLDEAEEKRNIQALLKTMRPSGNFRRLARLARSYPPMMAALMARPRVAGQTDESKRHLGSVLGGKRRKRAALHDPLEMEGGVEYPALSYEYEYEEGGSPVHEEKRFLGKLIFL
jgi:hypothetical protein